MVIPTTNTRLIRPRFALNEVPGALIACSSGRLLSAGYGGAIRQLRESGADDEARFNWAEIQAGKEEAFVGANDGFETRVYDQTGNGFHLEQSILVSQPRSHAAGVADTLAGHRCGKYDGTNDYMVNAGTTGLLPNLAAGGGFGMLVEVATVPSGVNSFPPIWGNTRGVSTYSTGTFSLARHNLVSGAVHGRLYAMNETSGSTIINTSWDTAGNLNKFIWSASVTPGAGDGIFRSFYNGAFASQKTGLTTVLTRDYIFKTMVGTHGVGAGVVDLGRIQAGRLITVILYPFAPTDAQWLALHSILA